MSWPIERKGERVVVVRISSNKANVITLKFMQEFNATLDKLESEYKNDAVVLTGNGSFFSAGLDLKYMGAAQQEKRFNDFINYIDSFESLVARLFAFPRPLVAAIEGHASMSFNAVCFPRTTLHCLIHICLNRLHAISCWRHLHCVLLRLPPLERQGQLWHERGGQWHAAPIQHVGDRQASRAQQGRLGTLPHRYGIMLVQ